MENKKGQTFLIVLVVILAIAVIILGYLYLYHNANSTQSITPDKAGIKAVDFANTLTGGGVTLVSTQDIGDLYLVNVSYKGQNVPAYITKDGKYFVQGAVLIDTFNPVAVGNQTQTAPKEVPRTDKPTAQAFVFAYCPYGLQFEKALLPAYDLLKDKVDISIVYIGAMHGPFEETESYRQICIEKNYGRDKLFTYLKAFDESLDIGACSGKDTCLTPLIEKIFTDQGIDKTKIATCMTKDAPDIYKAQGILASSKNIGSSPTFLINGVEVGSNRNPQAIKTDICNAFNTAPSECNQTLPSDSMVAGFGASAGTATGSQCN